MDKILKRKQPKQVPTWLMNSLKGFLLFLLAWKFISHYPTEDFFDYSRKAPERIYASDRTSTVKYNPILAGFPKLEQHYIQWGNHKIPYSDPEIADNQLDTITFSKDEFEQFWSDSISLHYKGHLLSISKINAIFILDGTIFSCEDKTDFLSCYNAFSKELPDEFGLWLSIKSKEEQTFFTKIKITQSTDFKPVNNEQGNRFWKQLINKDKHKVIDNLTVVKPVFKNDEYIFKWGNWERITNGPRGGRRIKLTLSEIQEWANNSPDLYKDGTFVPFNLTINYWKQKIYNPADTTNYCFIRKRVEKEPIIFSNECFNETLNFLDVGDSFTLYFTIKDDLLKSIPKGGWQSIPDMVIEEHITQKRLSFEIIEENSTPNKKPLILATSIFNFQLNSSKGKTAIVKIDANDQKNKSLEKQYTESKSAKVIHINNFKTIRRLITKDDMFIQEEDIEKIYTLNPKTYDTDTYPEFYDFGILPPLIKSRGLSPVLDKTIFSLEEYKNADKEDAGIEMYLGEEKVKVLQFNLTIIPKEGKAIQYITNDVNRFDIKKRIKKLEPETSIYFDKILFERNTGEQLVFPLATALHLR